MPEVELVMIALQRCVDVDEVAESESVGHVSFSGVAM